ncbi:pyridine nucleotide-disulfide oxidoreductase-domain-containing protein [Hyaloraphidium curvatum]|nr:pyridine nucleotide-disulfide oxidoreductase-domain-containing protein [Hyaloraphidium curvatum]
MSALECTYLVIGAGNAGVSFADAIVPMVPDATVILADRNDRPGGHWTHAYPFVSLHQPAAGYGVLSRELSVLTVDRAGVNKGYEALASGQEVEAYMKRTVHELEGTGRLRFLGLHEWVPERGVLRSLVTGKDVPVKFKKIVFGNHHTTITSAMRPPPWRLAPGVACVPSRSLPDAIAASPTPFERFCIIGGGKTAMDCIVWLMLQGVGEDKITWVVPRDFLFINRETFQNMQLRKLGAALHAKHRKVIAGSKSFAEAARGLVDCGFWLKLAATAPDAPAFHGAVITHTELGMLNTIKDVEKRGHILSIDAKGFDMKGGRREMPQGTLYVDCAAPTVKPVARFDVFEGDRITLPFMAVGGVGFSAALAARMETLPWSDAKKNSVLRPTPFPDTPAQYFLMAHNTSTNMARLFRHTELARWAVSNRLSPMGPPEGKAMPDAAFAKMAELFEARAKDAERLIAAEAARGNREAAEYLRTAGRDGWEGARL